MSRSLLRHHTLRQIPHVGTREKVREFIKQSALMFSKPGKAKDYDIESDTISDVDSMALQLSDQSTSDILDGKRAIKKRLEDRKKRRRHLAELRSLPQHRNSSPSSSRRRHFDRKIEEKKAKKRAKTNNSPIIQDRSRSKADRLRKEARSKERRTSTRNKYLDLLQFNGASSLKRDRITIPQPKFGIFSRGTASPYSVDEPKVKYKKRKRSPSPSTEDEDCESSTSSMSVNPSFEIDNIDQSRIEALEEQIKELQNTVKSLSPLQQKKIVDNLNTTPQAKAHQDIANVTRRSPEAHNEDIVVNVEHMPWSRDSAQHHPTDPVIQDDPPVLAFNGDRPDMHPNGWRAQHTLHHLDLNCIQKKFVDEGGANFIPGESKSAPKANGGRVEDHEQRYTGESNKQEYRSEQDLDTAKSDPSHTMPHVNMQINARVAQKNSEENTPGHDLCNVQPEDFDHLHDRINLIDYRSGYFYKDNFMSLQSHQREACRHSAISLPETNREKSDFCFNFSHMPTYDSERFNQGEIEDQLNYDDEVDLQQNSWNERDIEHLPQWWHDDQTLPQPEYHETLPRQDVGPSEAYAQEGDDTMNRDEAANVHDCMYKGLLLGKERFIDNYTYSDSYDHDYADTIYSTEPPATLKYSSHLNKRQELDESDFEGFWHPHRLI